MRDPYTDNRPNLIDHCTVIFNFVTCILAFTVSHLMTLHTSQPLYLS